MRPASHARREKSRAKVFRLSSLELSIRYHEAMHADGQDRKGRWIFVGCGALVGLLAIAGIGFVFLFSKGRSDFTPYLEDYLALVDRQQDERAYDSLGDEWKAAQSFEEYDEFAELMRHALGQHRSVRTISFFYRKDLGAPTRAQVVFRAEFEKDQAVLRTTFRKYEDEWRLEGLRYESDSVVSALTCPHCETVNDHAAEYCSKCGEKIARPWERVEGEPVDKRSESRR